MTGLLVGLGPAVVLFAVAVEAARYSLRTSKEDTR